MEAGLANFAKEKDVLYRYIDDDMHWWENWGLRKEQDDDAFCSGKACSDKYDEEKKESDAIVGAITLN